MPPFEEAVKKASKKKNIMKMVKMAGPEKQLYFILELIILLMALYLHDFVTSIIWPQVHQF